MIICYGWNGQSGIQDRGACFLPSHSTFFDTGTCFCSGSDINIFNWLSFINKFMAQSAQQTWQLFNNLIYPKAL